MAITTRKMVALVLTTGSAKTYTLDTYEGDVTISGMMENYTEAVPVLDRGTYVGSVEGDDQFPTMTVTVKHDGKLTNAAATRLGDFLHKTGFVSGDTTTDPEGRVWMMQVVATVTYPGGGVDTFTAVNARLTSDYSAAVDGNTLSLTWTCYRDGSATAPIQLT